MKAYRPLTEEYLWILVLYCMISDICRKTNLDWKKLISNRSNIKNNKIASILYKIKDECETKIKPNQKLYRARTYKNSDMNEVYNKPIWNDLFSKFNACISQYSKVNLTYKNVESLMDNFLFCKDFDKLKNIFYNWITDNKDEKFWGYSAEESGRNKKKNNNAGRLNKKGEHHLYLAYDINTAIAEVRPINQQQISVATINIKKELNLFDLTKTFEPGDGTKDGDYFAYYEIARMCSIPNFNDNTYYRPTQKISRYIKELGFDGIIYPSALKENGKNVLIFEFDNSDLDEKYFEIIGTDVYTALNEIKATKILPFKET